MSWQKKTRINQDGGDEEILTPDGHQIMVGASQDQVLLYQLAFNNWGLKTRTEQVAWALKTKTLQPSWNLKTKIEQ